MAEHRLSAEPTHSRWNRALEPRLEIESGDVVHFECLDSSGAQLHQGSRLENFLAIDRGRIHALTGPLSIHGAQLGDTLQIDVLEVSHQGWGWSSILPGLGLLKHLFPNPDFFVWELEQHTTSSLAPAIVPLRPFCGVMGVAPADDGEFRTRPPGNFGGNMDVQELCAGATLYLPVLNPGALFSCGDAHAAQGDGEVCINGIECPADVTLRFHLHRGRSLAGPLIESSGRDGNGANSEAWIVIASNSDLLGAAKDATARMIDLLMNACGFSSFQAYLLCSVAMNLHISQVVNEPMSTVSAAISKQVLPGIQVF